MICREFTINLISEWFVEAANHTCGNYDRGINEIELSGLTPVPSLKVQCHLTRWKVWCHYVQVHSTSACFSHEEALGTCNSTAACFSHEEASSTRHNASNAVQVKAPRIEESAVQLECVLRHTYDVKNK